MPSTELATIIAAKRANPYTPDKSVAQLRAETDAGASAVPLPSDTSYVAVDAGGVPSEWITTPGVRDDATFMFIHGGGYYRGSVAASRATAARFGAACNARCLSIDYRLAPEHPFPAAIDDTVAAYRWLLAEGTDPARLVVGGISAGGGLTLALLLALRDAGDPMPAAAVPLSPWTDLRQSGKTFESRADRDPVISKAYLDRMAAYYLGDADAEHPLASPLYGRLDGLAPCLVQVGDAETMLDDSRVYAERAQAAGANVRLEVWPDMIHGWHGAAHALPEAREAIDTIGAFFREHVN